MKLNANLIYCSIAALIAAVGCTTTPAVDDSHDGTLISTEVRIGTFDSRGVALAFGRSSHPQAAQARTTGIREAHDRARESGDEAKMRELEAEVSQMQERLHAQVFSGAPIDDILLPIKNEMPDIAKRARVDVIVSGVLYNGSDIEITDVTEEMCAQFEPDADTWKAIRELLATEPVPALKHGSGG